MLLKFIFIHKICSTLPWLLEVFDILLMYYFLKSSFGKAKLFFKKNLVFYLPNYKQQPPVPFDLSIECAYAVLCIITFEKPICFCLILLLLSLLFIIES